MAKFDTYFALAKEKGIEVFELYYSRAKSLSFKLYNAQIEGYKLSEDISLYARGIYQGKIGYASTEKISKETASFLVNEIITNAGTVTNGVYLDAVQTVTNKTLTGMASASTVKDSLGTDYTIGFRSIPQSLNTTAAASDIGKHLYVSATTTVPSGVFVAGNEFLVVNSSGSTVTLTQGAGTTLRLGGTATTGSRTIAAYGVASVLCVGTETFYVTGNVT
jgi:hypothetical protein